MRAGPLCRRVVLVALLVLGLVAPAGSAHADESWRWPSTGSLDVAGAGFGHGKGMSQWGARGAAAEGLDTPAILAHYYPGTALETRAEPLLRVWIRGDTDNETEVVPASGLRVVTPAGEAVLPSSLGGQQVTRWRAVRTSAGLVVQGLAGSWRTLSVAGQDAHASPVAFTRRTATDPGTVRVVRDTSSGEVLREYRGDVRAAASGSVPGLLTVVVSSGRDYLRSVVPAEMPATWEAAAVRAQAVAARTYASFEAAARPSTSPYDTCDTTQCQVFAGAADYRLDGTLIKRHEHPAGDTAVDATAGQVVTYGGTLAFTQFSAANGGWTADGGRPYLTAFPDPYDGVLASTAHAWTDTVEAQPLESAYPAIGRLQSVSLQRDGNGQWGGRVTSVTLVGSTGTQTISGERFRSLQGLRSTWWTPSSASWADYDAILGPGDWDGDGTADVVARDSAGLLWLQPGTGTGTMAPRRQIGSGWGGFTAIVGPGDWNGDTRNDLLARTSDGRLLLYPGNGTGGFHRASQVGSP
ncbi:MAG: SpoIID/LytB domain-containing protein [Actinomycetes bacterium]